MNEKPLINHIRNSEFIQEHPWASKMLFSLVGGFINTTFFHTPPTAVMNEIVNRSLNQGKGGYTATPWGKIRYFNGLVSMNAATMMMVSLSITTNQYTVYTCTSNGYTLSPRDKYWVSIASGAFAGIPASPIEAIAQAQQRQSAKHPPQMRQVIRAVCQHHGLFGLTRGMAGTACRSAGFTSGYLGLMPVVVDELKKTMGNTPLVYAVAGVLCGSVVAPITAPFNLAQMMRKNRFDLPEPAPRYRDFIQKLYKEAQQTREPLKNFALNLCGGRQALIVRMGATSFQFAFLFWFSQMVNQLTTQAATEPNEQKSLSPSR